MPSGLIDEKDGVAPQCSERLASQGLGFRPSASQAFRLDFQMDGFAPIEFAQNSRQISETRVAARAEHAHQILRVDRDGRTECIEAEGGVDVIASRRRPQLPASSS